MPTVATTAVSNVIYSMYKSSGAIQWQTRDEKAVNNKSDDIIVTAPLHTTLRGFAYVSCLAETRRANFLAGERDPAAVITNRP